MKMTLLAVGSKMPRWVDDAFNEYARRLPREAALHLQEIKPEKRGGGVIEAGLLGQPCRNATERE